MRSEVSGQLYNSLLAHVKLLKMNNSKERNMLQAENLANKLDIDAMTGSSFGSKKEKLTRE